MLRNLNYLIYCLLIIFIGCTQSALIKVDLENPDINKYLSSHFMGELGTLPVGFEIDKINFRIDTVYISGKVFDEQTKEPFPIHIWVGKFVTKKSYTGYVYIEPLKRLDLLKTEPDGNFYVKFKICKDDVLFADEIGYHPGIFKIYKYLVDGRIL